MTQRLHRKVIRISAVASPNVRLAETQIKAGLEPTGEVVCPGVLTWDEYQTRRATWREDRQVVGLDGDFYEGKELLLFPPVWLNRAEEMARQRRQLWPRKFIGVDVAEGSDETAWAVVDRLGLIHLLAYQTPDTNVIPGVTVSLMTKYGVKAQDVNFDRGGGKTHADRMRAMGYGVRTTNFGEPPTLELKRGVNLFKDRVEVREEKGEFKLRNAQMYGELSELLDPGYNEYGFTIPAEYQELRRQLSVFPRWTDEHGKMYLPRKKRKPDDREGADPKPTLYDMLGRSPDHSDALVLAVHAMLHLPSRSVAGVM